MHNNIMAAGSRGRPPMLAIGGYPQWRSRLLRYINTRPNGDALRKCIFNGPYIPTTVVVQAVAATDDSSAVPEHTTPEWSRFVTIVKQQHKLDEVSYHKLFDILKQYQKEVNELRAKRLARNANPLTLKSKRVKDSAYHKEKMLLWKQAKKSVPLQAEQYDWLADTDEEIDEQESEAHYSYMAKIQEVPTADSGTNYEPLEQVQNNTGYNVFANKLQHFKQSESISNTCLVEIDDSNVIHDSPDMCDDDIRNDQNDVESDDERVALANLIDNLKLDTEFEKYKPFNDHTIDYDKLKHQFRAPTTKDMDIPIKTCLMPLTLKIQNDSFVFVHELKKEMHADLKYVESLEKEIDELKSDKAEFSNMYDMILQEFVSNEVMCLSKPVNAQTLPQTARQAIVQLILFIVDSGCMKHMTGNLKLLCNFFEKYLGTVRFDNDLFAPILGYGDLVQENITINRVYYVEGLNHNLFSVGQFCDADLEVAFRKSTCFVRDLQGNDLLTGNRGSDLYTIFLQESKSSTPLCLMAKALPTQAWLWHQRLSYLNFDYINLLLKKDVKIGLPKLKYLKDQLCSSCEASKEKRSSFKSKNVPSSKGRINLLHMDLCGS
nr:retrovirus-related Pol polyprotein from transposon TNT 1-94 [Tanacetum cinerariifolium]